MNEWKMIDSESRNGRPMWLWSPAEFPNPIMGQWMCGLKVWLTTDGYSIAIRKPTHYLPMPNPPPA